MIEALQGVALAAPVSGIGFLFWDARREAERVAGGVEHDPVRLLGCGFVLNFAATAAEWPGSSHGRAWVFHVEVEMDLLGERVSSGQVGGR